MGRPRSSSTSSAPISADSEFVGRDLARHLARQSADLALQLAHAGLAGVAGDDLAHRVVGDHDLLVGEAGLFDLARNQVALGDLELLRSV